MSPASLVVEMGDGPRYGYVHVAGCRDVRDPLPLGAIYSLADLGAIVSECTGWDCEDHYEAVAACVKKVLR